MRSEQWTRNIKMLEERLKYYSGIINQLSQDIESFKEAREDALKKEAENMSGQGKVDKNAKLQ